MRILFVVAALFMLSGCETLSLDSVYVGTSYSYHHYNHNPSHISYTLGFYSGHYYNGHSVYGDYGHRYYYAPPHYMHHRYYTRPHHYVQPTHHYVQPRHQRQHVVLPRPQRQVQNRHIDREKRELRTERRRGENRKRK